MDISKTEREYAEAQQVCRRVYGNKMRDYGTSWRIMRPSSLTDQIFIKAMRIRSIEEKGEALVDEGILPEFIAIVNYCIMALIQLELGPGMSMNQGEAMARYEAEADKARLLMFNKNHDYDEAWRMMRVSSFTDIILQKLMRTRELEDRGGEAKYSEGIDANYLDMINYALFAVIRLTEAVDETKTK